MILELLPYYNVDDDSIVCEEVGFENYLKDREMSIDLFEDVDLNLIENFESTFEGHADTDPDVNCPLKSYKSTYILPTELERVLKSDSIHNFNILSINIRSL